MITQDSDFGTLVFRDNKPSAGVILVRIPDDQRTEKARRIIELIEQAEDQLPNAVTTLELNTIRIRPLPKPAEDD